MLITQDVLVKRYFLSHNVQHILCFLKRENVKTGRLYYPIPLIDKENA